MLVERRVHCGADGGANWRRVVFRAAGSSSSSSSSGNTEDEAAIDAMAQLIDSRKGMEERARRAEAELKAKILESNVKEVELTETVNRMSEEIRAVRAQLAGDGVGASVAMATPGGVNRDPGSLVEEIRKLEALMARMVDPEEAAAEAGGRSVVSNGAELKELEIKLKTVSAAEAKASERCRTLLAEVRKLEMAVSVLYDPEEMEVERGRRVAAEREVAFLQNQLKTLQQQAQNVAEERERYADRASKAEEAVEAMYTVEQLEKIVEDTFVSKNDEISRLKDEISSLSRPLSAHFIRGSKNSFLLRSRQFSASRSASPAGGAGGGTAGAFVRAGAGTFIHAGRQFSSDIRRLDGSAKAPVGPFVRGEPGSFSFERRKFIATAVGMGIGSVMYPFAASTPLER